MFNPEPTDLFVSTLCLYLAARMLVRRSYGWKPALGLGIALGAGEMVRQFSLWTLAVVVLAWLAALWWRPEERRELARSLAVMLAAVVVIAAPWYGYRAANYGNAIFDRPHSSKPLWDRRPASFYVDPALGTLFTRPYRPNFVNLALPETYADMWGDWYGVFAWSRETQAKPSPARNGWLVAQNVIGLVPTALAIGGWLVLLVLGAAAPRPRRGCSSRCSRSPDSPATSTSPSATRRTTATCSSRRTCSRPSARGRSASAGRRRGWASGGRGSSRACSSRSRCSTCRS